MCQCSSCLIVIKIYGYSLSGSSLALLYIAGTNNALRFFVGNPFEKIILSPISFLFTNGYVKESSLFSLYHVMPLKLFDTNLISLNISFGPV